MAQTPEEAGAAPPTVKFQNVFDWIVETAKHSPAPDADEALKLFIDIDMSILGTPWPSTTLPWLQLYCCSLDHVHSLFVFMPSVLSVR